MAHILATICPLKDTVACIQADQHSKKLGTDRQAFLDQRRAAQALLAPRQAAQAFLTLRRAAQAFLASGQAVQAFLDPYELHKTRFC